MSGPNSPGSGADKTFRFISDPGHKENLSGRVRAACLTCRRKKIKCSGELNCQTCREKGLICEGLPERKRPRRDSSHKAMLSSVPANVRKRKLENVDIGAVKKSKVKQQTESPKSQEADGDYDSDYASTQRKGFESIRSPSLNPPPLPNVDVKITYKQARAPKRSFHVDSWQLEAERPRSIPAELQAVPEGSVPGDSTAQVLGVQPGQLVNAHTPGNWSDTQERGIPWHEAAPHQILRPEHTNQHHDVPSFDMTSRRQSMSFPLPSRASSFEQQRDPFAGGGGAYDDIATLLYARMGMEPGANAFHGPWDMNADLAGLLSQQVLHPQAPGPRQTHSEPDPQSLTEVFGHWPQWPNE